MLAKVPPPFVFPCDFTHQLGREGPREALQPAWRKREGAPGEPGKGAGQEGKEAPRGLVSEGHGQNQEHW